MSGASSSLGSRAGSGSGRRRARGERISGARPQRGCPGWGAVCGACVRGETLGSARGGRLGRAGAASAAGGGAPPGPGRPRWSARPVPDSRLSPGTRRVSAPAVRHRSRAPAGPPNPQLTVAWFRAFKFTPRGGGDGGWSPRGWPRQWHFGAILGESRDGVWGVCPAASLPVLNFAPLRLPRLPSRPCAAGPGSADLNIHDFLRDFPWLSRPPLWEQPSRVFLPESERGAVWAAGPASPLGPALSIRPGSLVRRAPALPPNTEPASVGKTLGGRVPFPGEPAEPWLGAGRGV